MKALALLIAIAALAGVLTGCEVRERADDDGSHHIVGWGTSIIFKEVTLDDGTRCVLAWGRGSAITCDWENPS